MQKLSSTNQNKLNNSNNKYDDISKELQVLLGLKETEASDFFNANKHENLISCISLYLNNKQISNSPEVMVSSSNVNTNPTFNSTSTANPTLKIDTFSYKPPKLIYDEYTNNFKETIKLSERAEKTLFVNIFLDEQNEKESEELYKKSQYDVIINPKVLSIAIECFQKGSNLGVDTTKVVKHVQSHRHIKIMKNNFGKNHANASNDAHHHTHAGQHGKLGHNDKNKFHKDSKKNKKVNNYYDQTPSDPSDNKNLISSQGKNTYVKFDPFSEGADTGYEKSGFDSGNGNSSSSNINNNDNQNTTKGKQESGNWKNNQKYQGNQGNQGNKGYYQNNKSSQNQNPNEFKNTGGYGGYYNNDRE